MSGQDITRWAAAVAPELDLERSWQAQLVAVHGPGGSVLDRAVVIPYKAPRSYTGENLVELVLHGSEYLVEQALRASIEAGCRAAEPGEMTLRAVANGKLDLVQAEGINDLIKASTRAQAENARAMVEGKLSKKFREMRSSIVSLLARLEAAIDFLDQEELGAGGSGSSELEESRARVERQLEEMLATADRGERVRKGVRVVITGPVNAGKSTLFNTLVGSERAIVAASPGTTRDVLEARLEIGGCSVVLIDTAGIRTCGDEVEEEGVRRAREQINKAQVALVLWPVNLEEQPEPVACGPEVVKLRVRTMVDLLDGAVTGDGTHGGWLAVSAHSGAGLEELRQCLEVAVLGMVRGEGDEVAIAARHRQKLEAALQELRAASLEEPELAAEALRWAIHEMGELIGEVTDEQVIHEVFSLFCLGK